jgi:hypothetical protein
MRRKMRALICGGRDFKNVAFIWTRLDKIHAERPISAIIQGGASGVDEIAAEWAKTKRGLERYVCRADWEKHGRAAGPLRNARMLEWKPNVVIAFPGGRGTANMVKQARDAGVEVIEIN